MSSTEESDEDLGAPYVAHDSRSITRSTLVQNDHEVASADVNESLYVRDLEERPQFNKSPERSKVDICLTDGPSPVCIPGSTAQWLRPYQLDGISFLYDAYTAKIGRILGDDMGLGKTVQVIAFLNAVFFKSATKADWALMRNKRELGIPHPRVLIVCPGTLIENWTRELDTWSYTHYLKYHGVNKASALAAIASHSVEVLITTYQTYRSDADEINKIYWDVVIADECHIIKEQKSKVTQAMNEINSKCRIGLTGTAIQNNYEELWTLLNWTQPGQFGSAAEWMHTVSKVLKNGQKYDASNFELDTARKKALEIKERILPTVLLRRTKSLIADQLPTKTDRVVFCPLSQMQIDAYNELMSTDEVSFLRDARHPCDCGSGKERLCCCYPAAPDGSKFATLMFRYLHYMRQLSNHLALILPSKEDEPERRERYQDLLYAILPDEQRRLMSRTSYINGSDPELCGKWKVLVKLLKHWKKSGGKVLVFSSSVKLLDMLNDLMTQHSYSYEYLHGGMSLEQRSAAVDNFNNNPEQFVFLISTRAGGVGLNIVSANKVVIFDPNWNPAHDLQAQDRAYRIGQHRDVEVYRLVSVGTVEEVVYARQIYKQQQANIGFNASEERRYFRGVQGDENQQGELFGIENLLTFHGENHVLRNIFKDTSTVEQAFDIKMATLQISQAEIDAAANEASRGSTDEFGLSALVDSDGGPKLKEPEEAMQDPVAAIFADVGVQYTHQNNDVVGQSKVEMAISRMAADHAQDANLMDKSAYETSLHLDRSVYKVGNAPLLVQKRQFRSIARFYGYSSTVAFALDIQKMTPASRKASLMQFYKARRDEPEELNLQELEARRRAAREEEDREATLEAQEDELEDSMILKKRKRRL